VLAVDEESVARTFQQQLSDSNNELQLDDAAKLVGCWNGLAKIGRLEHAFDPDSSPMRRAVAFAGNIADSKRVAEMFTEITEHYARAAGLEADGKLPLQCTVQHVDGTFNALERNQRLDWLKEEPAPHSARILTNARCLSEGVDVPALDAVMFLSPRKSIVDIVQSVGRVMRLSKDKQFGYIILPVGIPAGMSAETALADNKRYAAVWEVLQALRAHDERFDAMVNRIDLTTKRDPKLNVIGVTVDKDGGDQLELPLAFQDLDLLRDTMYAKIVAKVGSRRYWTEWANSVADIATRQTTRIKALLSDPTTGVRNEFDRFLEGLRGNLNDGITESDAIDMLAQHLITRPVFEALFTGSRFLDHNPVAKTMERMLAALDEHDLHAENEQLEKFYDSVRMRVEGVNSAEGRQKIIYELYDTFFSKAFKKTSDKLGIVYTPVEIVDFILRSADAVLRQEFGQGLTDDGVHVLDPFTGTGTFMVRLLQLGLVEPHDLARKYAEELHANEILLLAYYIAAVNIETTFYDVMTRVAAPGGGKHASDPGHEYVEFPGLVLTDTFQSWEPDDNPDLGFSPENNERLKRLKRLPITVIVGNPPYSSGQDSANDDNANEKYPSLDEAIEQTYLRRGSGSARASIYDSYIRAIKWATLRIKDRGVVAYVTNGGFIDSNSADGMRKSLADEFSSIYIFNLRGNQRTAGETSRREGGKVFDAGSRATVAITVLVKNGTRTGPATVAYVDVGDYLSRDQKLAAVAAAGSFSGLKPVTIVPNEHGDWLNQRRDDFATFAPIFNRSGDGIFTLISAGLKTNRDAWVYGSSRPTVAAQTRRMADAFNKTIDADGDPTSDATQVSWRTVLRERRSDKRYIEIDESRIRDSMYRPFMRQRLYFDRSMNEAPSRLPEFFPSPSEGTIGFWIPGAGSSAPFQVLALRAVPDLVLGGAGNPGYFVGLERAERSGGDDLDQLTTDPLDGGARWSVNLTPRARRRFEIAYGAELAEGRHFYYVYGVLHSEEYRETYAADLKKMLPRIPLVEDPRPFVEAGFALAELHLGYEEATPYPLDGLAGLTEVGDPYDFYRVQKMAFAKVRDPETKKLGADRSTVLYNSHITLSGVPEDAHRYQLGSRSAVEWILERYQVKTDKASGIVNDPNDWSREVSDPRYIIDLLARIVTVSLETMSIVAGLPALAIRKAQNPS
jgi:predicted helicase